MCRGLRACRLLQVRLLRRRHVRRSHLCPYVNSPPFPFQQSLHDGQECARVPSILTRHSQLLLLPMSRSSMSNAVILTHACISVMACAISRSQAPRRHHYSKQRNRPRSPLRLPLLPSPSFPASPWTAAGPSGASALRPAMESSTAAALLPSPQTEAGTVRAPSCRLATSPAPLAVRAFVTHQSCAQACLPMGCASSRSDRALAAVCGCKCGRSA